jgi:hypothetical protein
MRLVQFVPETKDELIEWNQLARTIETNFLLGPSGLSHFVPHFLWHYLADADIRMKDEKYAVEQSRRIDLVLEHLKCGVIPSDEDTYF